MTTVKTTYDAPAPGGKAIARDQARELLGHVMGYVAVTVGFAALGAYLGRNLTGAAGLGAARPDRVRDRRDLRLDPQRPHHLRRRRTRDLRRVHDLRLQPAAPSK